jgi:predicted RND superfamily exporter protein
MERQKGHPLEQSLSLALRHAGRAMLLSSVLLFFGFGQLLTSSFKDAQAIGFLVNSMLLFALLADFFLGPYLIYRLLKPEPPAAANSESSTISSTTTNPANHD